MPSGPVLGWRSLGRARADIASVVDGRTFVLTRSGRSALVLALQSLGIKAGDRVLVPNYYCATMPGAVEHVGATPLFYPIDRHALPDLAWLRAHARGCRAMLAAHFFGLPAPLGEVRRFCDESDVRLIEDCAHTFFGETGGAAVGSFGHCAIASLPKFFPVIEGGVLVCGEEQRAKVPPLPKVGALGELKACWNLLESAAEFGGNSAARVAVAGVASALARLRPKSPEAGASPGATLDHGVARVRAETLADPLLVPMQQRRVEQLLVARSDRRRIVAARRSNYAYLARAIGASEGVEPLFDVLPHGAVPYVFPVRVEPASDVYVALRSQRLPVLRWDTYWPGAIETAADVGRDWGNHVLQILCHQDLTHGDLEVVAGRLAECARRAAG